MDDEDVEVTCMTSGVERSGSEMRLIARTGVAHSSTYAFLRHKGREVTHWRWNCLTRKRGLFPSFFGSVRSALDRGRREAIGTGRGE